MICNGASFKIENFMAFGLTHKSYSIVRKLLHDTQVYYKAHGPLVIASKKVFTKLHFDFVHKFFVEWGPAWALTLCKQR